MALETGTPFDCHPIKSALVDAHLVHLPAEDWRVVVDVGELDVHVLVVCPLRQAGVHGLVSEGR